MDEQRTMRKVTFTLPFTPKVKERPRMTRRGRAFTPKKTLEAEAAIAEYIDETVAAEGFDGAVGITIKFRKGDTKVTITERQRLSKLRGDVDNYAKLILDAIQKSHLLGDDKQVVRLDATKENYK